MSKTVVCFGDSNTWGYDPASGERFPADVRWTGILRSTLGSDFNVIEEGLNGRTTTEDDPLQPHRIGLTYLTPCLESHKPLDLVIIMLGTNDLKARFRKSASDIAESAALLAGVARTSPVGPNETFPQVLLVAPPPIVQPTLFAEMFEGGVEKSQRFAKYYGAYSAWYGAGFFDAGTVVQSSVLDGIHFDASEHQKLGTAIAAEVKRMLG